MISKVSRFFSLMALFLIGVSNGQEFIQVSNSSKTYSVMKIDEPGFDYANDPNADWSLASINTDFLYPWRDDNPPPTVFRALHDENHFYFRYDVVDSKIYTDNRTDKETDVMNSDRVEIFFLSNQKMDPYYCIEIDADGQLFDYEARYYRQNDFNWNWPKEHIQITSFTKKNGYGISGKISLAYLRKIQALQEKTMHLGLFRADVVGEENNEPIFKWISWVSPDTEEPDFHVPSAFGKFTLVE